MKGMPTRAVAVEGMLTVKCVAAAAVTVIGPLVPASEFGALVAVIVWELRKSTKVALKVPTPFSNVALAGTVPPTSLVVKWTVPV